MQGYYQTAMFHISSDIEYGGPGFPTSKTEPEEESIVEYTVISRRSKDRAGLRYQRRGIDDESRVANFVETETIMRVEVNGHYNCLVLKVC